MPKGFGSYPSVGSLETNHRTLSINRLSPPVAPKDGKSQPQRPSPVLETCLIRLMLRKAFVTLISFETKRSKRRVWTFEINHLFFRPTSRRSGVLCPLVDTVFASLSFFLPRSVRYLPPRGKPWRKADTSFNIARRALFCDLLRAPGLRL